MKFLLVSSLFLSLGVSAANPTYEPNDGQSPPGSFTSKSGSGSGMSEDTTTKKVIKKTTIEKQEERSSGNGRGSADKPILDGNPNDETYKVGPLSVPSDPSGTSSSKELEEAEKQEDALDFSTTPEKSTVPQPETETQE